MREGASSNFTTSQKESVSFESQDKPFKRAARIERHYSTDSEDSCVCTSSWECKKHPGIPITELSDSEENRQVLDAMLASVRNHKNE